MTKIVSSLFKVETGSGRSRPGRPPAAEDDRPERDTTMMKGRIDVYEDNAGHIRAYEREAGVVGTRVYDCWERCDFGDLRKCIYEWLGTGVMGGVERTYSNVEEKFDKRCSTLIVCADCDQYGNVGVHVGSAFMGPAGRHAWGIKEEV